MLERIKRLEIGFVLGLAMGLLFGVISQSVNQIFLKDIPLYTQMPSFWVSIVLIFLGGGLFGVLASLPQSILSGSLLSAFSGSLVIFVRQILLMEDLSFLDLVSTFFRVFFPVFLLLGMLALLIRWAEAVLSGDYFTEQNFTAKRFLPVLVCLMSVSLIGGFFLKNAEYRHDLRLVNEHLKRAASAQTLSELGETFSGIPGFFVHKSKAYTLEPSSLIELYAGEPPEGVLQVEKGIVIVRYADGFKLTCLTIDADPERVLCEEFVALENSE